MLNKTNNKKGFTLIETFVAVTILLVAVLGPMEILSTALRDANYVKQQITAKYLAREGLELALNLASKKDASGQSPLCQFKGTNGNFGLAYNDTVPDIICLYHSSHVNDGCQFYQNSNGFYNHNASGKATNFFGKIFISSVSVDPDTGGGEYEIRSMISVIGSNISLPITVFNTRIFVPYCS